MKKKKSYRSVNKVSDEIINQITSINLWININFNCEKGAS